MPERDTTQIPSPLGNTAKEVSAPVDADIGGDIPVSAEGAALGGMSDNVQRRRFSERYGGRERRDAHDLAILGLGGLVRR